MTLLYYSPIFQEHRTGNHPESGRRLDAVMRHLRWVGLDAQCQQPAWEPISDAHLRAVHTPEHVHHIDLLCQRGGGFLDEDTVVSEQSASVARLAAGAVCDAVERVVRGSDPHALCLVRPPGHHALPASSMGFCLLNHVALAARLAIDELDLDRVLIVDWDVHHGNGTQDVFWEDEQVGFLSIHRWPFYPHSGAGDESGAGRGLGFTRNVPIKFGTSRKDYLALFRREIEAFVKKVRPQLILVSAGFDAHRQDPVGSLGLESEDFGVLTNAVLELAQDHTDSRLVCVLEGGYDAGALTDCVDIHLSALLDHQTGC